MSNIIISVRMNNDLWKKTTATFEFKNIISGNYGLRFYILHPKITSSMPNTVVFDFGKFLPPSFK